MKQLLTILLLLISAAAFSQHTVVVKVPQQDISGKLNKSDSGTVYVTPAQLAKKVDTSYKDITSVFAPLYSVTVNDSTHELHAYINTDTTFSNASDTTLASSLAVKKGLNKKQNYFIINVTDAPYNAVGDSSTDNTAAIQAAYNAVNDSVKVVYFPSGKFLISDSIVISKPCITVGQGGLMPYTGLDTLGGINAFRENHGSLIIQTNAAKSGIIVNAEGVQFDNIAVKQGSSSNPSGYGIKFNHGNSMRMGNCSFTGFYYNTWVVNGIYWNIDKCQFINGYKNNLRIEHQQYKDGGDATLTNSYFVGGKYDSLTQMYYTSGGGLKMSGNKFQNGVGTSVPLGMIDVNITAPGTSIFMAKHNSFENFKNFGIRIRKDSSASFSKVNISDNQFSSIAGVPNSAIDIQGSGFGGGSITAVSVNNNIINITNGDSAAIRLGYVVGGNVSGNIITNGLNKYKFTNVTNITDEIPGDLTVNGNMTVSGKSTLTANSGFSVNPTGAANMLLGGAFSFNSYAGTTGGGMAYNAYLDSISGWKYRNNGPATVTWSDASGSIIMYTAPSGVAGATPSFTPQFSISSAGLIRLLSTTDKAGSFITQDASGFLYKRTSSESLQDMNGVNKSGTDTITGIKTFTNPIYLTSISDAAGDFLIKNTLTGQVTRRTPSEALTDMNGMNAFYTNTGPIDLNTIGQGFHSQYSGGFTNGPSGIVYGGTIVYSGTNSNNLQWLYDNGNNDGIGTVWFRLKSSTVTGGVHSWQKVASTGYVDTTIFPNKKWVIFGDSFSADDSKYWGTVRDKLKLTNITTFGISGQTISQQSAVLDSLLASTPTYFSTVNIVSILVGINDFSQSQPLGSIKDTAGQPTYAGYLRHMIEKILTANPKVELYILTPPEANSASVVYKATNSVGWTVRQMSVLISQICSDYSVQCVDLYDLSQFNLKTIPTLTVDGLHPNAEGSKFLGNIVANAFINRNNKGSSLGTPAQKWADSNSTGTAAPTTTPSFIGQEYLDLTNKKYYKAFGTSSSSDWVLQN